jgi:hypothetical protein
MPSRPQKRYRIMEFEKPKGQLTSLGKDQNFENLQTERPDWSLFRTMEGLQQRAGVAGALLSRLVLKEIADNGLDAGAKDTRNNNRYDFGRRGMTA